MPVSLLALSALLGLATAALQPGCTANGRRVTCTYNTPASTGTFVVPDAVSSLDVTVTAGAGGPDNIGAGPTPGANGATLVLTGVTFAPGTSLVYFVGQNGGTGAGAGGGEAAGFTQYAGGDGAQASGSVNTGGTCAITAIASSRRTRCWRLGVWAPVVRCIAGADRWRRRRNG